MDDIDRLRLYCVDAPELVADAGSLWHGALDPRTSALVRIGALIAAAAPAASMRSAVEDAVSAGVSVREIVAVLDGMVELVGLPRAVAAAPRIAAALGYADDLLPDAGG
ncbi:hypothetical protein HF576_11755 [Microbacterium sp. CFH 90308]|uniref:Carboxymuconolactone decarboxylase-like domain-containing protein n=1 Tax=Microbacterium salsuginis TaxID=2722803 RepID=A0ABX1KBW5_9MICO|nr:carboxymuconolactone decarboxylase family protein [Microbacterium sp. CFH 90308]NLP84524.1 hypothetical protein [Microbacterium sp. CFH 90308]